MVQISDGGLYPQGDAVALSISMPGSSIFDNIVSWINTNILSIFNAGGDLFVKVINAIGRNFILITFAITDSISQIITKVADKTVQVINAIGTNLVAVVGNMTNFFQAIIGSISSGVASVITSLGLSISGVLNSLTNGIIGITGAIGGIVGSVTTAVSNSVSQVITSVANSISTVITTLTGSITNVLNAVGNVTGYIITAISGAVSQISQTVVSTISAISTQIQTSFTWITDWLGVQIPKILGTWFDTFVGKILDFPMWIGKLFDAVGAWITHDVPGHSPWWHFGLDTLFSWIKDNVFGFFNYFFADPVHNTIYGLNTSFAFLGDFFGSVIDGMMNAVISFTSNVGPGDPSMALTHVSSIGKVAMASLTALAAMTLTGEVVGFWKHIGLGNISAIFYDMSNYKLITAGMMGALVGASIRTPLGLYFSNKFRQNIPSIRELQEMYTDESLTDAQFSQWMGYHGIADSWHDKYKDIAYRAMSPYQLKVAATDGSFDEGIFSRELTHAGFRPEIKGMLMDSFRKASLVNLKVTAVTSDTYRFKKGFTDEDQFVNELKILQVGDAMIPAYLAATKLDYASDYLTDLETAYQNAVRAGQIGVDDYRQDLLNLGIVPERVEGKVFIEQARIKPIGAISPVSGAKAVYLTDAGKLIIDTTRRKRRKNIITRDQELAAFSDIGMPVDLAAAYADNDDARLGETAPVQAG